MITKRKKDRFQRRRVYCIDHTKVVAQITTGIEGTTAASTAAISSAQASTSRQRQRSDHRFHGAKGRERKAEFENAPA